MIVLNLRIYFQLILFVCFILNWKINCQVEFANGRYRQISNEACKAKPRPDWYNVVQQEARKKSSHQKQDDLVRVLLPNYTDSKLILNNITSSVYLYSAFASCKKSKYRITIVAIVSRHEYCGTSSTSSYGHLSCVFDESLTSALSPLLVECLPEHHNQPDQAALLHCDAVDRFNQVQVRHEPTGQISNQIDINYEETNLPSNETTICVRSLHNSVNVVHLLEFFSYYRTQGITRVALYYYPYSQQSSKSATYHRTNRFFYLLQLLSEVELHSFPIPASVQIHAGGQLATIHDCLLRYRHSVQLHIDFDEFIVGKDLKLNQLIEHYLHLPGSPVALYISNLLHCHEFNLNSKSLIETKRANLTTESVSESSLLYLKNRFSQKTPWKPPNRSKVIVLRPRLVLQMGIHTVWKFTSHPSLLEPDFMLPLKRRIGPLLSGARPDLENHVDYLVTHHNVDPSVAVMQHFRWCCNMKQPYFLGLMSFRPLDDQIIYSTTNLSIKDREAMKLFVIKQFEIFLQI